MKTIGFAHSPWGYIVQVYDGGNIIHEYQAGNSHYDSQQIVPLTSSNVEKPETLAKFAKQSALELAIEYEVDIMNVNYDSDLEDQVNEKEPQFSSITVLSDGETFTSTKDCIVCEYDENSDFYQNNHFFDDADEVIDLVKDGSIKGRILSVDALVKLYDAVFALDLDTKQIDLSEVKKQFTNVRRGA